VSLQASPLPASSELDTTSLFREHAPYVWRALRRLGVRDADAEDVCQEVFVVVHRRLGDFQGRSNVRTWIYGIAVRTASDYRRRASNRREVPTEAPPDELSRDDPHDTLSQRQRRATLDRLLDELDEDKRAVFVLYEIEELPMSEIAVAVGCPLQTAYSRLHAARQKVTEAARKLRDDTAKRKEATP
jgi:RNA polymerase sigma-70 factor (ECF subfamily)